YRPVREEDRRTDAGERRAVDRRPGSISPKHRGYRPAEAGAAAVKRRWTDSERAGRDEARSIRNRAESGRREAPHHRGDRDDRGYGTRGAQGSGGGFGRGERRLDDRPRRDERPHGRFGRDDRPRPGRDDRPRFDRGQRPARDVRPRGEDRFTRRDEHPRFDRGE